MLCELWRSSERNDWTKIENENDGRAGQRSGVKGWPTFARAPRHTSLESTRAFSPPRSSRLSTRTAQRLIVEESESKSGPVRSGSVESIRVEDSRSRQHYSARGCLASLTQEGVTTRTEWYYFLIVIVRTWASLRPSCLFAINIRCLVIMHYYEYNQNCTCIVNNDLEE